MKERRANEENAFSFFSYLLNGTAIYDLLKECRLVVAGGDALYQTNIFFMETCALLSWPSDDRKSTLFDTDFTFSYFCR